MINVSIIPFYLNVELDEKVHSKKSNRVKYLETTVLKLVGVSKQIYIGVQNDSDVEQVKQVVVSLDLDNVKIARLECNSFDLPIELCKKFKSFDFNSKDIIFFNEADQFLTNTITLKRLCSLLKEQENIIYSPHRMEKLYKKKYGKWLTGCRVPDFDKEERLPFTFFGEQCYHPNTYKRFLNSAEDFYKSPDWVDAYAAAFLTTFETFKKIPFERFNNSGCLEGPCFATLDPNLTVLKTTNNSFSIIHLGAYEYNARVINEELTIEQIIEDHRKLLYNEAI